MGRCGNLDESGSIVYPTPSLQADQSPPEPAVTGVGAGWRRRHPLAWWLIRRLVAAAGTLLAASALIFIAADALPGNVGASILGRDASPQAVAQLNRELGQDKPLVQRYLEWLGGAVHGDLGQSAVSLAEGTPAEVTTVMNEPLGNSLVLAGITALLLIPLSFGLGVLAGVRAGRPIDALISGTSLALVSLPEFVLGALLILLFFSGLNLLPPVSLIAPGQAALSQPKELILPVLTLLGVSSASGIRLMRAGMIEVLGQEYVQMARLNGYSERRVIWRHALRNALGPGVTIMAQNLQYLLGGIVIVESVFTYPGIGTLFVSAVTAHDVTEIEGIAVTLAAAYILINLVADFIVLLLVPKLRTQP
jgi:peptide/nickel transport system permease protein